MSAQGSHSEGSAVNTGLVVFALLAVLTVVEFVVAVSVDWNLPIIMAFAVLKAGLIVYYFMHVVRAWVEEEGG